jgi:hypothetical protein
MICPVLGQSCAHLGSAIRRARLSKAASRYSPIAIDRNGLPFETVASLWIIWASALSFFTPPLPYGTSWKPKRSAPPV